MIQPSANVFDSLAVLADPLRCRMLFLLEKRELSVAELVKALQLPQSTISRHLKVLAHDRLVASREDGASNRYRARLEASPQPVRRLWTIVRDQTAGLPAATEDARRLASVLAERRTRSQAYFSSAAGQWDRIREEMFGATTHLQAMLGLLDPAWTVGDLGCGTGHVANAIAPFVRRVIGIDDSAAMLAAARKRLAGSRGVELRRGDILQLPLEDGELDLAIFFIVLPYVEHPAGALEEAARVLGRGRRVLIVDMQAHEREDLANEMGHLRRGFSPEEVQGYLRRAGFRDVNYRALPAEPAAKGPSLFVATAERK